MAGKEHLRLVVADVINGVFGGFLIHLSDAIPILGLNIVGGVVSGCAVGSLICLLIDLRRKSPVPPISS